ncbi:hypothetical protein EV178_004048 [Coemansia sp. RSA 1646]|nr:hypothetical protein EV178_004048 [Coemansia sp. RSA 1646]
MNTTALDRLICSLRAAGGVADSCLRVDAVSGGERGVLARPSDIRQAALSGSPLVHVPASLIITAAVAIQSDIVRACLGCVDESGEALQLALFVLTERARGATSAWHWYVDYLPESGVGALFFDAASREALSATPLRMAADAKLRQLHTQYDAFSSVLYEWKTVHSVSGPVDYEAYKWANFIVLSRAVSLQSTGDKDCLSVHAGSDRALVPLLDMLNHSSEPLAHWSVGVDGAVSVFANGSPDHQCLGASVGPSIELCFSYGDKSNTEWLYEYGFVPESNDHDIWPYFSLLSGSPSFVAAKQMWMLELGLSPRVMLSDPGSPHGSYAIPRSTMLNLCLAALDDTSDSCSQQVGATALEHPYFTVDGLLVDDDDKLLQVPGLCIYALTLCSHRLVHQAEAMQANLDLYACSTAPIPHQKAAVTKYIVSALALVRRIAEAFMTASREYT